uniref:Transposase n=1 Tax=Hordeum vulgare subsp. vulgare TaxID=112509 RepID=A0A8I6YW14_HORVV
MYKGMKKDIEVELQNLDSRICLTSDMWTSSQNLGYMSITAHYIDAEFNYKKKIISFTDVKYPHTGYAIEEEIVGCLTEWGIRGKLFTLTLDNASNNTNACDELIKYHKHELLLEGQHLHVRCCAHILNILVQDGMKIIHGAIDKIRELLKYIDSSSSRLQEFNTIAIGMGLPSKKGISVDTPTRWNSTWKMLVEALRYKSVLTSYANRKMIESPSEQEWKRAEAICDFLKAFEELTLIVSAHRKPTAHKFLPVVLCIRHALKDPGWQTSDVLKELAAAMQTKLDKYWDPEEKENAEPNRRRKSKDIAFNHALVIATFLDPRRKEDYLDFFYCKLSTNEEEVSKQVEVALEWVRKYFKEYELLVATSTAHSTPSSQGNTTIGSPIVGKRKLEEEFAQHKSHRRTRVHKSELDAYLEEASEEDGADFDILAWWKRHAEKFPILATMARDFLAIPLSTVASEAAFSCGKRILGDSRSSLTPDMLEALVCAKDWLFIPKKGEYVWM